MAEADLGSIIILEVGNTNLAGLDSSDTFLLLAGQFLLCVFCGHALCVPISWAHILGGISAG